MKIELQDKKITVLVYYNKKEYIKYTKQEISNTTIGQCSYNIDNRTIYIGIFDNKLSTLVHELYHCLEFVQVLLKEFNDRDVHFSESNAYLIEHLFKTIKKGYKKWEEY